MQANSSLLKTRLHILLWEFVSNYPGRCAIIIGLLLLAGIAEGFGVATVLPVLGLVMADGPGASSKISQVFVQVLEALGLPVNMAVLLSIIVLAFVLKAALVLAATTQIGFASAAYATELRHKIVHGLVEARWGYFTSQTTGGLANTLGIETSQAAAIFPAACTVITLAFQVIVYLGLAFLVSWKITIASVIAGCVIMMFLGRLIDMARRAANQQRDSYDGLAAKLVDGVQSIKSLKAMALENRLEPLLQANIDSLNMALRKSILSVQALLHMREPFLVAFLSIGILLVLSFTDAPFESLIVMALLFTRTVTYITSLQKNYQGIVSAEPFFRSIQERIGNMEGEKERFAGTRDFQFQGAITFEDVSFSFGSISVLHHISLEIRAGLITAIVGATGSGKTTVTDLVIGLYRHDGGDIRIDNMPLSDIDIQAWRRQIGYVPQETLLYHDSILKNITLGDTSIVEAEVNSALMAAGAWGFVSAFPDGIHTIVGERGSKLSGGQRQRISIARALVRNPRILILDEPTAALDTETEAQICASLRDLAGEMSILLVSHQPALVEIADVVYRMDNGTAYLLETGTFAPKMVSTNP